ncbi:putative spermidine/putrescine transport system substrate-binding protein [Pseudonocardia thermophila]|jgi:Spermidine/putrescine-binding periplasmic protein|uniref:Putative spermidine/putrescine transport system substrate-binding protein n=1 Tax=Pseudonocardia thermophila TaxID=1848 RepID=A0A1M6PKD6_PSETH|nr:extracellular solute-binding protein [Pseudonocardia thermophila]SHK08378.1 putative spermidine/putrescine transport system substrate-binding protein [Pseudonocardia thermophila]
MKRTTRLLVITIGSLLVAACGVGGGPAPGAESGQRTLTWASTGGQFQEDEKNALQIPFTQKTGVQFINVSPAEQAQVRAMVTSGKTIWDLANMSWIYAGAYCGELFEELDHPALDRSKFPPGTTSDCFVPTYRYANIFSYNADMYPGEKPSSIKDFFDVERFPGKRVVFDYPKNGLLEAALVADGVPPEQVYPLDVDRAFRKIDTIKGSLVFAPSYGAIQQMLVDKQASMVLTVTARTIVSAQSGANLVPVWDFTTTDIGALVIPKGTPNKDLAQEMLAFVTEPEQAIAYARLTGTAPSRPDVDLETVGYTEEQKRFNAFLPNRGVTLEQDKQWWIENTDALTARYTSWKVG